MAQASPVVSELASTVFLELTPLIVQYLPLEDVVLLATKLNRAFCAAARQQLSELWTLSRPLFKPPLSLSRRMLLRETWLLRNGIDLSDAELAPLIRVCARGAHSVVAQGGR